MRYSKEIFLDHCVVQICIITIPAPIGVASCLKKVPIIWTDASFFRIFSSPLLVLMVSFQTSRPDEKGWQFRNPISYCKKENSNTSYSDFVRYSSHPYIFIYLELYRVRVVAIQNNNENNFEKKSFLVQYLIPLFGSILRYISLLVLAY